MTDTKDKFEQATETAQPKGGKVSKAVRAEASAIATTETMQDYTIQGRALARAEDTAFVTGYAETKAANAAVIKAQMAKLGRELYGIGEAMDTAAIAAAGSETAEDFTQGLTDLFNGVSGS